MLREITIEEALRNPEADLCFIIDDIVYYKSDISEKVRILRDENQDADLEEEAEEIEAQEGERPDPEPALRKRGRLSHKDRIEHLLNEGITDINEIVRLTGIKKETVEKFIPA